MQQEQPEDDFSLTYFFSPLNTPKALFIIVTVGLIVFTNGLFNGFVADDGSQIIDNPVIHSISNIFSFFSGSTFYNGGVLNRGVYYKPLLNTFFSFVYIVFGPVSFWFHFFQIGLHIANASILFLLLKRFFRLSLALFFSLVFLVHPINSEAVFYISASQEMLFFFFGMVALHILTKAQSQKQLLLATGFLLLSLLSKESGILFFGAALAYTAMFRRRYILPLLGYLSTAFVVYILLRIHAIGALTYPSNAPIGSLSLLQRLINTPAMFLVYLKTLFFPRDLSSSYQWAYTQIDLSNFLFPLLIDLSFIAIICSMASVLHKKHPKQYFKTYTFFAIWFFIGILLHLQIFPLDATASSPVTCQLSISWVHTCMNRAG